VEFRVNSRKEDAMLKLIQGGISPSELDALVAGAQWDHWCRLEPTLASLNSLADVRRLRGEQEDAALLALLRIASPQQGDDYLAAVAVLHQLGGSIRTIARKHAHLTDDDAEGIVAGAMWDAIRSYDWRKHPHRCVAVIYNDTRSAVRKMLMPDATRWRDDRVVLLNPQSWPFDASAESDSGEVSRLDHYSSEDQLAVFLGWAARQGLVDEQDLGLLVELLALDRANVGIPKWLRGVCSMSAVEQVAADRGQCFKSVARARDRVVAKLREAAPQFLDEVA